MKLEDYPRERLSDNEQLAIHAIADRHEKQKRRLMAKHQDEAIVLENRLRKAHPATDGKLLLPQGEWLYLLPVPSAPSGLLGPNGPAV